MICETLEREQLAEWLDPPLWGMIHLPALPGSPAYAGSVSAIVDRAREDAEKLVEVGFGGLVVENFGDLPFHKDTVPPVTVAALARVTARLRELCPGTRIMVNCLRNDAAAGLSVATVCEADAIRINVHTGAAVTDQGVLEGQAGRTLRLRRELGSSVRIFADVAVKHAVPLAERPVEIEASDLRDRGRADALLVTGAGTGREADVEQVEKIRRGAPTAPVLVASGVTAESAADWARVVDGAIIGSGLMNQGRAGHGVDRQRAQRIFDQWMNTRAGRDPVERETT